MYPAYTSKHNSSREKQIIFLMIPNGERWYYLAVKRLSVLMRGIKSTNNSNFYCLNCLHSFRTKNKLELHKRCVKIKIFVVLECLLKKIWYYTSISTKTLISHQPSFTQILNLLLKKILRCKNYLKNYLQQKQVNIFHLFIQCVQYGHMKI